MKVLLLMPADLHLLVGIETMHISQTRFAISKHYRGDCSASDAMKFLRSRLRDDESEAQK